MVSLKSVRLSLTAVFLLTLVSPVFAAVFTWDGTNGGNWNDSSHWLDSTGNPGGTPYNNAANVGDVNSGQVNTNGSFTGQLNINAGGQLGIGASWPGISTLHLNGGKIVNGPGVTGLNGRIYVDSHSYISASIGSGIYSTLFGSGDLEKNDASTTALVNGQPNFMGRYIVSGGGLKFNTLNAQGSQPIILRNNSKVFLSAANTWVLTGDLSGTGTVSYGNQQALNPVQFQGIHVSPGEDGAGTLTCTPGNGWGWGDVSLAANGSTHSQLVMDVLSAGGVAGTDYDQLIVTGNSNLAADRKVNLQLGNGAADLLVRVADTLTAADMAGKTLTIASVTGGGIVNGTFANINFTGPLMAQTVTYGSKSVTLSDWVAVPEPATLALLAMTGLVWLRRRAM